MLSNNANNHKLNKNIHHNTNSHNIYFPEFSSEAAPKTSIVFFLFISIPSS